MIVIKKASGGVSIMRLVGDADVATCISQWQEVNPDQYVMHVEILETDLPADQSTRARWKLENGTVVLSTDSDTTVPAPTKEQLLAQLNALSAQIQALE
jgi:hypothetical protein